MNILFLQLPLVDFSSAYKAANIQYAASVMSAWIHTHYDDIETHIVPDDLVSIASNRLLIEYIESRKATHLCITCYAWNSERSIELARQLYQRNENLKIFFGGPETASGSWLYRDTHEYVSAFVRGEGEWFSSFLIDDTWQNHTAIVNGNRVVSQPEDALVNISLLPDPLPWLEAVSDGSGYVELTRGCPYRCSYCFYSGRYHRVREIAPDILYRALESERFKELYILSPTFNFRKDFSDILDTLVKMDHGVTLHAEVRPEGISMEIAQKMYDAGFRSVETGIQSFNRNVLKSVGRHAAVDATMDGIHNLRQAGIEVKAGIIAGLPGETVESFRTMMTQLVEERIGDCIEFYPLMVLPGTKLKRQADIEAIQYQQKPPYYYIDGWGMDEKDIRESAKFIAEETGYDHQVHSLPDFTAHPEGGEYISTLEIYEGIEPDADILPQLMDCNSMTLRFHTAEERTLHWLKNLYAIPGECCYSIVLESCSAVIYEEMEKLIQHWKKSYIGRTALFSEEKAQSAMRFFIICRNDHTLENIRTNMPLCEPVLVVDESLKKVPDEEVSLYVVSGMYSRHRNWLVSLHDESVEYVGFENSNEQQQFYIDCGMEYFDDGIARSGKSLGR